MYSKLIEKHTFLACYGPRIEIESPETQQSYDTDSGSAIATGYKTMYRRESDLYKYKTIYRGESVARARYAKQIMIKMRHAEVR